MAQDPLVGRLLEEGVRELAALGQPDHRPEHVLRGELRQRGLEIPVARGDRAEQRPVELASDDGGHVDHVGEIRQPVETLGEEAVEGRRHHRCRRRLPDRVRPCPALEHLQHLFDEQRDPVGGRVQPLQYGGVEGGTARRRRHRSHLGGRQRPKLDLEHRPALRPGRLELGPERQDTQDRQARQAGDDSPEQLDGRGIRPVEILDDEEQRMTSRVGDEQGLEDSQRRGAGVAGAEFGAGSAVPAADRQELREQRHGLRRVEARVDDRLLQHLQVLAARVRSFEAEQALEEPDDRVEGRGLVVSRALPHVLGSGVPPLALPQRVDEAALADPRLPRDMNDRALPARGLPPSLRERLELAIAAHDRGHAACARDLEAADRAGRTHGSMHVYRARYPLERHLTERLGLEVALDQLVRIPADHDRSRRGGRLEPCGDVRSLPDDVVLRARFAGAHLPHDHDSGVQPDPDLDRDVESLAEVRVHGYELVHDPEARVHGPLGIVLVRARVAEVGDHAVAEVLGRIAVEAVDGAHARVLVGAEDLAPVLGVKRPGERRRPDEVAEEHGHLTALPGAGIAHGRDGGGPIVEAATATSAEPQSCGAFETAVTAPHVGSPTTPKPLPPQA